MDFTKIQYFAVAGSIITFVMIIELVRRKKIKEQYSLLWIIFSLVFIVFSFWQNGIDLLGETVGIAYRPAAFFLLLILAMFFILIQYSVIISKLSTQNKEMAQEIGLLKEKVEMNLKNGK